MDVENKIINNEFDNVYVNNKGSRGPYNSPESQHIYNNIFALNFDIYNCCDNEPIDYSKVERFVFLLKENLEENYENVTEFVTLKNNFAKNALTSKQYAIYAILSLNADAQIEGKNENDKWLVIHDIIYNKIGIYDQKYMNCDFFDNVKNKKIANNPIYVKNIIFEMGKFDPYGMSDGYGIYNL